jgi:hypothetical protein
MNSGATSRKYNHRSIYARYTLYLAPGCAQENIEIALHAAGLVGASENLPFPQLSQLQQGSGNVIERERKRLPPLQRGNPGPPPLRRAAEHFVERLVVGRPRSFEENMRERKAEGEVEGGGLRWKGKGWAGD